MADSAVGPLSSETALVRTIDFAIEAGSADQDRAAVFRLHDREVLVVADGAGGLGGGAETADAVIDAVARAAGASRFATWPSAIRLPG